MRELGRASLLVVTVVAAAAACRQSDARQLAAAGATSDSPFLMGPQPGADRAIARPVNPYAGNTNVLADGRRLFNWYNCSGCHGDHAGGGMGPSLRDERWLYGGTDANVAASIAQGRANGMPSWGPKGNRA